MSNKPIFLTAFLILFFCGSLYASDLTGSEKSISGTSSKELSKKKSGQFSRDASSNLNRSYDRVAEPKSMPAHLQRQGKVRNGIDQLINSSRKASSDIRNEIKKIKAQKNVNTSNVEIKKALNMADQLDKYARLLQKKKKLLTKDGTKIDESLRQTLSDISQMDMLKLQDAMNKQSQLMQMMSNIQKMMNDTSMGIIKNLK